MCRQRLRSPLKRSNVELLLRGFAGWGKEDPAKIRDILHPACELIVPESVPYGGTFRGADAFVGWFTEVLWRFFDEFSSAPERVIDAGNTIIVPVSVKARTITGGRIDVHNVWVYEFRAGRLRRARVYADTAVLRDAIDGFAPAEADRR